MKAADDQPNLPPTANELYANAVGRGVEQSPILAAAFSHQEFGSRLVRLKFAGDASEFQFCLQHLTWVALGKNRSWNADAHGAKKLARQVLEYWLTDTCPKCLGRGAITIRHTPLLGKICPECADGIRPWVHKKDWEQRGRELLWYLDEHVAKFGGAVRKLLKSVESPP